jgi:23S rRNA (adenine2503-C2)-methyltransferase
VQGRQPAIFALLAVVLMIDILSYSREELGQWLISRSYNPLHTHTLYRQIYQSAQNPSERGMSLPQRLQEEFAQTFQVPAAEVITEQRSKSDGSVKFLYKLRDGAAIESVLMPEASRITLCISSQVGCGQACSFCHTGRMGLLRNLSAGEIVGQVVWAQQWLRENHEWLRQKNLSLGPNVSNIVFMGMGEPLDNTAEVIKAIKIITDPYGLQLAPKRVSVSTAGVLEGLQELIAAKLGVSFAFSLHSADSMQRSQLMRINRRYPLEQVLAVLQENARATKRNFLIQYTLIAGVNDSPEHMVKLGNLLAGMRVKVNLIPYNVIEGASYTKPLLDKVLSCYHLLADAGIRCMIRFSKGQDIAAACGQLAIVNE